MCLVRKHLLKIQRKLFSDPFSNTIPHADKIKTVLFTIDSLFFEGKSLERALEENGFSKWSRKYKAASVWLSSEATEASMRSLRIVRDTILLNTEQTERKINYLLNSTFV